VEERIGVSVCGGWRGKGKEESRRGEREEGRTCVVFSGMSKSIDATLSYL
jgi:hypothetical protein